MINGKTFDSEGNLILEVFDNGDGTRTIRSPGVADVVEQIPAELLQEKELVADRKGRAVEGQALADDLQTLRDERDQARDNRLAMVEGDDLYLSRWDDADITEPTPLTGDDGAGGILNNRARLDALEVAVNDLNDRHVDVARMTNALVGQFRKSWGTHRLTLVNLIRAIRAGQLDQ